MRGRVGSGGAVDEKAIERIGPGFRTRDIPVQVAAVRLEHVSKKRNELVHSNWGPGYKPGATLRYRHTAKAGKGHKYFQEDVTPADVRALADDIGFVALRVAGIFHREDLRKGLWDEAAGDKKEEVT